MDIRELLGSLSEALEEHGISTHVAKMSHSLEGDCHSRMICVTGDLGSARSEMLTKSRDHVVMVRVDAETLEGLDSWINAGVASSRSEAAALFMREGLSLRGAELDELAESIAKVEEAKQELRKKAQSVVGGGSESTQD